MNMLFAFVSMRDSSRCDHVDVSALVHEFQSGMSVLYVLCLKNLGTCVSTYTIANSSCIPNQSNPVCWYERKRERERQKGRRKEESNSQTNQKGKADEERREKRDKQSRRQSYYLSPWANTTCEKMYYLLERVERSQNSNVYVHS